MDTTKDIFHPMEYLRYSFDTGQIEDGFSNSKLIKGYRSSYPLPNPEHHESSYNLLTQWDPGEKPLPLFRMESTSELTAKTRGVTEFSQQNWVYCDPNVGSPQVSFLTCTLEIPQKLQHKFFALNFCYLYF